MKKSIYFGERWNAKFIFEKTATPRGFRFLYSNVFDYWCEDGRNTDQDLLVHFSKSCKLNDKVAYLL